MPIFINATASFFSAPDAPTIASFAASATVYDIISTHPRLKTLTTALKAAKLDTVLQGAGPFTVFAPVDEAFVTGNMQSYKVKFLLDTNAIIKKEKPNKTKKMI